MSQDALDRNLKALLTVSYRPQRPTPAFRESLRRAVLARVAPRPAIARRSTLLLAAAAVVLAAGASFLLRDRSAPEIPPAPAVAGTWIRHAADAPFARTDAARTRLLPGEQLEVKAAGAHVVETAHGDVRIENGELRASYLVAPGDGPDDPSVQIRVERGSCALLEPLAWVALPVGVELRLHSGRIEPWTAPVAAAPERSETASDPPAVAAAAASVAGHATGARGAAIERVRATLVMAESGFDGQPAYGQPPQEFDLAAPSGRFELPAVAAGRYRLFVAAEGFAIWRSDLLALGPGIATVALEIAMVEGAAVRGRVVDERTGAGVAGARVLSETDWPQRETPLDEAALPRYGDPPPRSVFTDADGRFELRSLSPGDQAVRAMKPGFAPRWQRVRGLADGETRAADDVALGLGGTVSGIVTDAGGAAVERSIVIAISQTLPSYSHNQPMAIALSGPDGRYALRDLPAGTWIVIDLGTQPDAGAPSTQQVRLVEVAVGDPTTVDFAGRSQDRTLAGRLVDAAGKPIARQSLSIAPIDDVERSPRWRGVETGDDGTFETNGIEPGEHEVFLLEDGVTLERVDRFTMPDQPRFERTIALPAQSISGRVVEEDTGLPVPGALILLELLDDPRHPECFAGKRLADERGAFRFRALPPGVYRVSAFDADGARTIDATDPLAVAQGTAVEDVLLRLAVAGRLELTLTGAAGAPIAGAEVTIVDGAGRAVSETLRSDARGIVVAEHLPLEPLRARVATSVTSDEFPIQPRARETMRVTQVIASRDR